MNHECRRKLLTLCIIHQASRVLLGMKKRGFGQGRWNGFGGKVLPGETVEQAALRELKEEAGITARNMEKRAVLEFEFRGEPEILETHLFRCTSFEGAPTETEEMAPQWFHHDNIPFHTMWPDDKYWFPLFLAGKTFRGKFLFEGYDMILTQELKVPLDIRSS